MLRLIARKGLGPGDRLPSEHAIARSTGAGRSSVREAFQLLAGKGLIDAHPGKGYYLRSVPRGAQARPVRTAAGPGGAEDIEDVREARIVIEGACAALAATRATPADVARIDSFLCGMEAKQSCGADVYEDTLTLHLMIADAAHNRTLHDILRVLIPRIAAHGAALASEVPDHGPIDVALHRELWATIRSGSPTDARAAMERHIRDASSLYLLPYEWPALESRARPDNQAPPTSKAGRIRRGKRDISTRLSRSR